ncbi:lmo0937 family membrane protein [Fulvivirga maritima]|nr:lmo0937 family membrane protein [Fulvivirga maritima]UII29357.1 lmo0937 family membrane protein [Fulvivirga maritima]
MKGCFLIVLIVLILGWLFGFFYFDLGWFIHVLLIAAVIILLLRLIGGR